MKYLYIVLILICSNTFAQTSFERKIGEFDKIIIYVFCIVTFLIMYPGEPIADLPSQELEEHARSPLRNPTSTGGGVTP